ncbi:hypothetical protein [Kineosporia sp. NBRC 101731]|uniref:hypothetical protein n=1 Tax=Kineosporia sp. NBRC 101731 TaxID=3032199 RepID=UPI00255781B7|nr:hypothetical protein [Kineosporia sp. NBRC 101731]
MELIALMAAHESTEHASAAGGAVSPSSIEQVQAEVRRLARDFTTIPPLLLLAEARRARDATYSLLDRTRRPVQTADLYLAAGQLCGLMASASFDLTAWDAAEEQSRAANVYAELVDHPGLRSWARGTQALVQFWTGRPRQALIHVSAGLDGAPAGTALARLKAIEARALSQLGGDPSEALQAVSQADEALTGPQDDDLHNEVGGEFGWEASRHDGCISTALLAMGDSAAAAARARASLAQNASEPVAGGVDHVRVNLAAANLRLNDLDAATEALTEVWDIPVPQRRHSLTDRLGGVGRLLAEQSWRTDPAASELRDRVEVFNDEARWRALPTS